jgi:hypothetical protein
MFNPILSELVARERYKDFHRQAEQSRLIKAGFARQPAHHFAPQAYLGNLLMSVRHLFKVLARAD